MLFSTYITHENIMLRFEGSGHFILVITQTDYCHKTFFEKEFGFDTSDFRI